MHFHTSISLTLVSLALSAPTENAAAPRVTKAPEKRPSVYLVDQKREEIIPNPTPELITERGAVEGCSFPDRGFTFYHTIAQVA